MSDGEKERLLDTLESLQLHTMPLSQLYQQLNSSSEGLDNQNSKNIRLKHGMNKIPPPLSAPAWLCCLLPCLLRTKAMLDYNEVVPELATVKRGKWMKMDAASLVPGDVIEIRDGDRVPADVRIIESTASCRFDTSAITGDSTRRSCSVRQSSQDYIQSPNMAFLGFLCTEGECVLLKNQFI